MNRSGSRSLIFLIVRRSDVFPVLHDVVSAHNADSVGAQPIGTSHNVCSCGDVKPGQTALPRWRVDIMRNHAEHLGTVTAPNAQEALNRAASLFRIEPSRYNKLMITKIEERRQDRFID